MRHRFPKRRAEFSPRPPGNGLAPLRGRVWLDVKYIPHRRGTARHPPALPRHASIRKRHRTNPAQPLGVNP
jgi:hypothetical protein